MDATPNIAAHVPQLPEVSADYPAQRWFGARAERYVAHRRDYVSPEWQVYRAASAEFTELSVVVRPFGSLCLQLDATDLRRIAHALLDAAHDLEANSSAALMQAIKEGA